MHSIPQLLSSNIQQGSWGETQRVLIVDHKPQCLLHEKCRTINVGVHVALCLRGGRLRKAQADAIIFVRPTSQNPHRGRVAQLAEQLTLNQ